MGNVGNLILSLVNAEGGSALEPDCTVEIVRLDQVTIARADNLQFPPKHSFSLPAFPQAQNLRCVITPSLYRLVQSEFFTLNSSVTREEPALVPREPSKWAPTFVPWNTLSAPFVALKSILAGKFLKLKHGPDVGVITPAVWDGMTSPPLMLAKMALLNLFGVLTTQQDPVTSQPWFNFVQQILVIDRERFVAIVTSDLYESISHILDNLDTFGPLGFFAADVSLHTDNIPSDFQLTAPMISAKRNYQQGNIQFTMAKARNAGGDCILLDCDMDEHSNILEHVGDLFVHVFTGGTHPIDIHEYIVRHQPALDLGYTLRPLNQTLVSAAAG